MPRRRSWTHPLVRWIDSRLPVFSFLRRELVDYPEPRNLNLWWSFGSLAGVALVILVVTGIFLAMHYTPHVDHAFDSVERIRRDVPYGWLIALLHQHASSLFFLVVYVHVLRGLYYGSYKAPREILWMTGVALLCLMIPTAFMGYVLPWGQMGYWAATVVTAMFSALPWIGETVVTYVWGDFSLGNATLNRFFVLHIVLPFVILALVGLHLWALHAQGSNNPLGIDPTGPQDLVPFHPTYTAMDASALGVFLVVFAILAFFAPDLIAPPENFEPADPLVTPDHIVPEWYLLPFYAMVKAIPNKVLGVAAMAGAQLVLFLVPWLDRSPVRSARFRPLYRAFFWVFVADCVLLGYVGAQPPEGVFLALARLGTAYFFAHFLIVLPAVARFESPLPLPASLAVPVLGPHRKDADG
jgi:ubiquinol-cytochrome c reductase cytochrome b/c1 subunit